MNTNMRKRFKLNFLILSTFFTPYLWGQGMSVSTPIALPDSLGNYHPQIELTHDNVPAILWTSATLKNL